MAKTRFSLSMPCWYIREGEVQLHTLNSALDGGASTSCPSCFTPRKETQYPLNRRLGGPQNRSRHFVKEKYLLPLLVFKPWTVQPVA
jgi:hypothetical protein